MIESTAQSGVAPDPTFTRARRWIWQGLAGFLFLVAVSAFVGFDGYFFVDEGAVLGQMEVMERGGWTVERPFPDEDPRGDFVPMANAHIAEEAYAPYVKHPVHMALAFAAHSVAGTAGVRLLSSLGVLGAAAAAAASARRRAPSAAATAFWVTLVLTPLLFDAQLVIAHGLAAAVAGSLMLVLLRERFGVGSIAGAFGLAALGCLLRNEFLLLCGAVLVWSVARAVRGRRPAAAIGLVVGVAAVLVHRFEPMLVRAVAGGGAERTGLPSTSGSREGLPEILDGARRSLFDLGDPGSSPFARVTLAIAVLFIATSLAYLARRRPDPGVAALLAVAALAIGLLHLFDPHVVRGIVWAFPAVLLIGVRLVRGPALAGAEGDALLVAAVFAVMVVITQYTGGGGPEWGWRYVAIAIPLVVPTLAGALSGLWARRPEIPTVAVGALLSAMALISFSGILAQRQQVEAASSFLGRVGEVVEESETTYVVTTDASFGRFAYPLAGRGGVAKVSPPKAADLFRALEKAGGPDVLLVWRDSVAPPTSDLGPYGRTGDSFVIYGGYRAETVRPGTNTRSPS